MNMKKLPFVTRNIKIFYHKKKCLSRTLIIFLMVRVLPLTGAKVITVIVIRTMMVKAITLVIVSGESGDNGGDN